ncbi:uncharacterized protein ACN427_001398 [Glossina fuscipes fuscipes]
MEGNKRKSSGDEIDPALIKKCQHLDEEQEELKSELARQKNLRPATEIEWRGADSTSQKKTLKKVMEKLTSHDKIVQIHFDVLPTDGTTVYSRAEDRLIGCGYSDSSAATTERHQTVVVFGVQSLLTAFNMLLSCYPLTSNTEGMEKRLEDNLKLAEEIGLVVKAVVCDLWPIKKEALKKFTDGIYLRRREDGSIQKIRFIHDHGQLLLGFGRKMDNNTLGEHYTYDVFRKLKKILKPMNGFWMRLPFAPNFRRPRTIDSARNFFSDVFPANLQAAIDRDEFDDELETAQSTCHLSRMITQFANVVYRGSITTDTWTHLKSELQECRGYLEEHFKTEQVAIDTLLMIQNFVELSEELLDLASNSSVQIAAIVDKMMSFQLSKWRTGFRTDDDFFLIKVMNYRIKVQVEEEFEPFDQDGVPFEDLNIHHIKNDLFLKVVLKLLTKYGIDGYIRKQLTCQDCLRDLTRKKEDICEEVHTVFQEAYTIYHSVMQERMVEQNIGKRIQATVVSRLDFFRAAGSCNNGSSHRINLLGYILFILLTGKNFTDPRGPNIHYL